MKRIFGILFFLALIWACTPDNEGEEPTVPGVEVTFERSTMLTNWADNIIIPSYEAFTTDVAALNTSFQLFKTNASEANLIALRSSWLNAYKAWQRVSLFEIGPAETVGLRLNLNIYPTDPQKIASGSPLPENVEAFYEKEVSKELFLEGLNAVQDFFNGQHYGSSAGGESLASYLDALNTVKDGEDLKAVINNQFNTARDMVNGLASFRAEIENNTPPTNMLLAYDEVQRAVPLLKVDMVSAMSISIDFVDADGD